MDNKNITQSTKEEETASEIIGTSLIDFFSIIVEWRKFISRFVIFITAIVIVIALLLPKWYKSSVSVLPAEKTDIIGGGLDGVSSLVKSFSGGKSLLGGKNELEKYTSILKSERLLWSVIQKFDLVGVYEINSYIREKTIKELISNIEIEIADEGQLVVSVYDKNPQRAAEMANYIVAQLNTINSEINSQNARANREFIEKRYKKNLDDLHEAEELLKEFQIKHGVLAVKEQSEVSIKTGAEFFAQLALKEVEQGILLKTVGKDSPELHMKRIEISELEKKVNEIRDGIPSDSSTMKFILPFKKTPEIGMNFFRLYRGAEIQYKILSFLTPLYEQAKVEEQRNAPSVVVLDRAEVAERKAKPKITLFALLGFVVSLFVAMCIVFTTEMLKRLRLLNPSKFDALVNLMRSDWLGLRWKK